MFDKEIVRTSLKDQILHKQLFLNKLSFDLNSKLEAISTVQMKKASSLIYSIRKIIEAIASIFEDLQSYFSELLLDFASEILRNSFKIMNTCFNGLSYLLLTQIKSDHSQVLSQINLNLKGKILNKKSRSRKQLQLDYYDSIINSLSSEEARLARQMEEAEANFSIEKKAVMRINPSEAVQQLKILRDQLHRIIEESETVCSDSYLYRQQQFYKQAMKIKTPEQLVKMIENQMTGIGSQNFSQITLKLVQIFLWHLKAKMKRKILDQIEREKPKTMEFACQFDDPKNKLENKKKSIRFHPEGESGKMISALRKEIFTLSKDLEEMKQNFKKIEEEKAEVDEKLRKKIFECQQIDQQKKSQVMKMDIALKEQQQKFNQTMKQIINCNSMKNSIKSKQQCKKDENEGKCRVMTQKDFKKKPISQCFQDLIRNLQEKLYIEISNEAEIEQCLKENRCENLILEIYAKLNDFTKSVASSQTNILKPVKMKAITKAKATQTTSLFTSNRVSKRQNLISERPQFLQEQSLNKFPKPSTTISGFRKMSSKVEHLKTQFNNKERSPKKESKNTDHLQMQSIDFLKKNGNSTRKKQFSFQDFNTFKHSQMEKLVRKTSKNKNRLIVTEMNEKILYRKNQEARYEAIRILDYIERKNDEKNEFLQDFLLQIFGQLKIKKGLKCYHDIVDELNRLNGLVQKRGSNYGHFVGVYNIS